MKITKIETKIMNVSKYSNWIFVLIHTDEGITGLGEATLDNCEMQVASAVEVLSEQIIGKDVLKDKISIDVRYGGMIYSAAMSGIDIALWDLKGKAVGKPVYKLLGGKMRDKIPTYVTFNRAITDRSPEGFAEFAKMLIEKEGEKAIKCAPFDNFLWKTPINASERMSMGIERFKAIRKALGERIEIHIDNHWRFDYTTALEAADRLREFRPFWFEAPLAENDSKMMYEVRMKTGLRIAGGEMQTSFVEYLPLLEHKTLDVYMPDIKYIGGITGILKACTLVEAHNQLLAPHNMTGPVSTAATAHVCANINNFLTVEHHYDEADWVKDLAINGVKIKDGFMTISDSPGLGVELDMEMVEAHPYKKAVSLRQNMLGG